MVLKKRQEYGFYGYQIPLIPTAPRSVRRRSLKKKSLDDGQLCAFELLAAVAGKLLQESESSASSNIAEGSVQVGIKKDLIKEEQLRERAARSECLDQGSCIESVIVPESAAPERDTKSNLKESPRIEANSVFEHTLRYKPDNILLDEELNAKVADFGLAKLLGREFSRVLTTIRGTRGYLAPEWISGEAITAKADVFSYGNLLFEIISGRRNRDILEDGGYFPALVAETLNKGEEVAMQLLDNRLEGKADSSEVSRACKVACWCIQDDEKNRP